MDCIFCKIAKGEIPSYKILENDHFFAFLDIKPISDGHTLVIPKRHCKDFLALHKEDGQGLVEFTKQVADNVVKATGSTGFNLGMNNGPSAGQVVFHAHIHVIPRIEGDGLVSWGHKEVSKRDLEEVHQKIISQSR